ncbi:hypothetical protein V1264_016354 [Littorina saxatilis]|uniref:Rho-GAP domain-containing protein n=1 Tax=Littorina saxatilis TaxID=31220 RepID=A0AAN9GI23_9CAEN
MFRNVFGGCVSDRSARADAFRSFKLKFGVPINSALKHGLLPAPLVDILVYIAKEGVATADVFRRPGNPNDIRRIVKRLSEGKQVIYTNYSFYTLASVVKKFLLKTPGGVLTEDGEEVLLHVLTLGHRMDQCQAVNTFIESLPVAHQQLLALLFGTWFRIVTYAEINFMSVEALSRSVAGSMFHTCAEDPAKVEKASRILQLLIDNFGVAAMFGRQNIQFFAETTHTGIHIREFIRYQYQYPSEDTIPPVSPDLIEMTRMEGDSDREACGMYSDEGGVGGDSPELSPLAGLRRSLPQSDGGNNGDVSQLTINTSTLSAPEVSLMPSPEVSKRPKSLEDNLNEMKTYYQSRSLSRFNSVKRKQLERLRQRSDWFLSPTAAAARNNGSNGAATCTLGRHFHHHHHHHPYSNKNGGGKNGGGCGGSNGCGGSGGCGGSSKNSGNSVTKASSEGTVLEAYSDADSVFTDHSSRSESPASEPVWTHSLKTQSRDIIHSDTLAEVASPHILQPSQRHRSNRHQQHQHHHQRQMSDPGSMDAVGDQGEGGGSGRTPREIEQGEEADGEDEEEEEEEYRRKRNTEEEEDEEQRVGQATDESETEVQCYMLEHQYGPMEDCS